MGFDDAIANSCWDPERLDQARRAVDALRNALRWGTAHPVPNRTYNNLDSDPLVPNAPTAARPASRLDLLDHLLARGPAPDLGIVTAAAGFCRSHQSEGPADPPAKSRALGRVWNLDALNAAYRNDSGLTAAEASTAVLDLLHAPNLADQQSFRPDLLLGFIGGGKKPVQVWSCHSDSSAGDPFQGIPLRRADFVDILGLGHYHENRKPLVRWAHRLPDNADPRRPTAWDAGVSSPFWCPGGRTRPLSRDGLGTGNYEKADGLCETVHEPVHLRDLVAPVQLIPEEI